MSSRQSLYVVAIYAGIAFSVVLSATILGVQGTLDSQTLSNVLMGALGFAGGAAVGAGTLGQAVNGKAVIPHSELANRETTLRTAIAGAASAPAHEVVEAPSVEYTAAEGEE